MNIICDHRGWEIFRIKTFFKTPFLKILPYPNHARMNIALPTYTNFCCPKHLACNIKIKTKIKVKIFKIFWGRGSAP
jgi:hypothetical protein